MATIQQHIAVKSNLWVKMALRFQMNDKVTPEPLFCMSHDKHNPMLTNQNLDLIDLCSDWLLSEISF